MLWKEIEVYCTTSRMWVHVTFKNDKGRVDLDGFMGGHGGGVHGLAMCPHSYRRIHHKMLLRVREKDGKVILKEYRIRKSELPKLLRDEKIKSDAYLAQLKQKENKKT